METSFFIFLLVLSIFSLITGLTLVDDNVSGFLLGVCFLMTIFCTLEFIYIDLNKDKRKLTTIEVYRGNTTLEYTVVDGVKVDSTVVWKNNQ